MDTGWYSYSFDKILVNILHKNVLTGDSEFQKGKRKNTWKEGKNIIKMERKTQNNIEVSNISIFFFKAVTVNITE